MWQVETPVPCLRTSLDSLPKRTPLSEHIHKTQNSIIRLMDLNH